MSEQQKQQNQEQDTEQIAKRARTENWSREVSEDVSWNIDTPFEKGNSVDEIKLQFDNDQSLFVSKGFLMYSSPVFDRMLKSEFREKQNNLIKMVGKDFEQFQDLLLHLHPGRRKSITAENAGNLYKLANEYQMPAVKEVCEKVLFQTAKELRLFKHWNEVNQENLDKAMEILLIGDTFDCPSVIKSAYENITRLPPTHFVKHATYRRLSETCKNSLLLIRAVRSDNGKYHAY